MATCYVKAYYDWAQQMRALDDAEKGRLFMAILAYAAGEETPLGGREAVLFPVFRAQVDRDKRVYAAVVENGRRGGAPLGNSNARKAQPHGEKQPKTTKINQDKDNDNNNDKYEYKHNDNNTSRAGSKRSCSRAHNHNERAYSPEELARIGVDIVGMSLDTALDTQALQV